MKPMLCAAAAMLGLTAAVATADDRQAPLFVYPPVVPLHNYPGLPEPNGYNAEPDVEPATAVRQQYEGGLTVFVGTNRNSRVPIGGLIRLSYEFRHPQSVVVDLSAIAQGLFGQEATDLKLRYPDEPRRCVRIFQRRDGEEVIERVEIQLQHFLPPPQEISFAFHFRYAHRLVDGVADFVTSTTPTMKITSVLSGNRSDEWRYGTFPTMPVRRSAPAPWLLAAGTMLIAFELIYGLLLLKQRFMPGRARSARQSAVAAYRRIERQSRTSGTLSRAQVTELAACFRTALGAESLTGAAIDRRFAGHRREKPIGAALHLLEAASQDATRTISGAEREQLLQDIAAALGDR